MGSYTQEQHDYIVSVAYGNKYREIADMFNEKYGTNKSVQAIAIYCRKHKINNGITSELTSFKKGHKSNWDGRELGSEKYNNFDDVLVKVQYHGANREIWRLKKELVWEKHYGKKPKHYMVLSLNGNKEDFNIENLMLCTTAEHMTLYKRDYISSNRALTLSALYYIRLRHLRMKRERQIRGIKRIIE